MRPPTVLVGAPQPVSNIPGNPFMDIHSRVMGFRDVNHLCGIPPPAVQRHRAKADADIAFARGYVPDIKFLSTALSLRLNRLSPVIIFSIVCWPRGGV